MHNDLNSPISESILDIQAPQIYRCNVFRYHSGLSRLYIRVFKGMSEAPSFYLFFSDVGYFDGPMNWEGADLRRAPASECLKLMEKVGMVRDFNLDDPDTRQALAESANLYVFHALYTTVRLIAGKAVKMDQLPDGIS